MAVKITAKDIARATGYSASAVSRAFKEGSPIRQSMRDEILSAAHELGYMPPAARTLAEMTTGSITLVTGNFENPFYPLVARALSEAMHRSGRRLILHAIPPDGDVDTVLAQVMDYRADAAIVTSTLMSSRIARACRKKKMPVVLFNRIQPDFEMTAVTCDNYGGGRLAAQRLIAGGRKRIALIGGREDTSTHLERTRGFRDALSDAGLPLVNHLSGQYRYSISFEAMLEVLKTPGGIDAVFCVNDIMALAAMDAARQIGADVPSDVAIIGFDDIPMASWRPYDLTTVRQPLNQMVTDAIDLIDRQLCHQQATGSIRIAPVRLIERSSA